MAVGVANPKAQGQAIMSTEIALSSAKERDSEMNQMVKVRTAIMITVGTK
jgi:hypothetical protein